MASADNKRKTGFDAPAVVLCGLAAVIFAIAFSLFMGGGFNALLIQEKEAKIYTAEISDTVKAQLAEQQTLLDENVRYLDPEKGVLCMPIEDAMDRVVTLNAR
jgi:hypothetical protein